MRRTRSLQSVGRPCNSARLAGVLCRRPHRPRCRGPQLCCRPHRLIAQSRSRCRRPIRRRRCWSLRPPGLRRRCSPPGLHGLLSQPSLQRRCSPCTLHALIPGDRPSRSPPRRPCMGDRSGRSPRPPRDRLGRSCRTSLVQRPCREIRVKVT